MIPPAIADYEVGFEDNDQLRSDCVRLLLAGHRPFDAGPSTHPSAIPKILVRFWHDLTQVPGDVRGCMDSWETLREQGFGIYDFDDHSAAAFINEAFGRSVLEAFHRCGHPAMRSDFFRLCFILVRGGFYVDTDDVLVGNSWPALLRDGRLKLQPLGYDIPRECMVPTDELWSRESEGVNRIFYVNNNPLVAPPDHPLIKRALARATEALLKHAQARRDVQSTTGPGNLTAALVAHTRELAVRQQPLDFEFIRSWNDVASTKWDLAYRDDERNWRNWTRPDVLL